MPTTIEVRPGEGGADAAAFADELTESITTHLRRASGDPARHQQGRTTVITTTISSESLQWIAGTHRVQRIPKGSTSRHTSTATVAVLDTAYAQVAEHELSGSVRIDRYRGRGKGGQRKNKVSTAVRVVHEDTGIVITRETGRSQGENLKSAERELREQLTSRARKRRKTRQDATRRAQVQPKRAAKTFTHNQQRAEVVDHQTGQRWSQTAWRRGRFDQEK